MAICPLIFLHFNPVHIMSTTKTGLSSLLSRLLLVLAILLFSGALASANPVIYKAGNPSKGKKIVFVASDHEYRAEETLPALARILAPEVLQQELILKHSSVLGQRFGLHKMTILQIQRTPVMLLVLMLIV